ncbi:MAG TPA: phytanoyl-CoA dioxygenase family protein [Pseudomonadales bacterium]
MLSVAEREHYRETGWVRIPGVVPPSACVDVADAVWRALERVHGFRRDDSASWRSELPRRLGRRLAPADLAPLATPKLIALIDDLLGAGNWDHPRVWAQPLPVFPAPGPWDVPSRMWHLDYPVRDLRPDDWAVKMLCLLSPLAPRGGGTLLLSGSHRLVGRLAAAGHRGGSADVRTLLAREHEWLCALLSRTEGVDRVRRFMEEGARLDGVPVRVVEVTGEPGDVVLFHPWMLHTLAPNRRGEPRLLLAQNFTARSALWVYRPDPAGWR